MTIWEMVAKDEELRELRKRHYEMTGKGYPFDMYAHHGIEDYRKELREEVAKLEQHSNRKEP